MDEFLIHGCEQVLRFTKVDKWDDLPEDRKVQLGFNMGVVAHGLDLAKEESFQPLADTREGKMTIQAFREHMKALIESHGVEVNEDNINRPF